MVWVDASHYNTVDLAAYFAEDVTTRVRAHDRIGQKVTEGTGYEDPTFAPRYSYCLANRLPFIGYHYDRSKYNGANQWDWFESRIRAAGGPRPFPLDLWCSDSEDTDTPSRARAALLEFTGRAVARGFTQGCVYSGLWYAQPYGIRLDVLPAGWRRGWLSDYTATHTDLGMPLPPGWAREQIMARQYTSTATVVGIGGPCDANRTLNDWLSPQEDLTMADAASLEAQLDKLANAIGITWYGDDRDDLKDIGTHPYNLQAIVKKLADLTAKVDALAAGAGGQVDADAVAAALAARLDMSTVVDWTKMQAAAEVVVRRVLGSLKDSPPEVTA